MTTAKELFEIAEQSGRAEDYIKAGNLSIVEDNHYLAGTSFEHAGVFILTKIMNI